MSYCLKTGGQILLADQGLAFECDLHVVDEGIIVAVITPPGSPELNLPWHTLTIPHGAEYLLRDNTKPYGFIVVPANQCIPTPAFKEHIKQWYGTKRLIFAEGW